MRAGREDIYGPAPRLEKFGGMRDHTGPRLRAPAVAPACVPGLRFMGMAISPARVSVWAADPDARWPRCRDRRPAPPAPLCAV